MVNITFSVDDKLVKDARKQAAAQNTSLNNLFRNWLEDYVARKQKAEERVRRFDEVIKKTAYFRTDRKYTREEMNER